VASLVKAAVVGGSGYTGIELIRLLLVHPGVELVTVTSRAEAGRPLADFFPSFRGHPVAETLEFQPPEVEILKKADIVFFATPNGTAMKSTTELVAAGVKVIDLAADFRLQNEAQWQEWYSMDHAAPELLGKAIYALADIEKEKQKEVSVIGNPGCYPTSVQLPLIPLLKAGLIDLAQPIIADCKSGISGAGRSSKTEHSYSEVSEDFTAYGIEKHRHWIEIRNGLVAAAGATEEANNMSFTFTPHLLPMPRGIFSTIYVTLKDQTDAGVEAARKAIGQAYADSAFVHLLPEGQVPHTKSVRGSNSCHLNLFKAKSGQLVITSAIDNLMKGAAGQAVQNMNLMFGLPEGQGLSITGITP
tara:strand:+ start:99 stop:1175 length:1077 start_codon:yes stop_codon:yes gene_type:complete